MALSEYAIDPTKRVDLYIGGASIAPHEWTQVHDPAAPKEVVGYAPSGTEEHAVAAVCSAHRAWLEWSQLRPEQRAAALSSALTALEEEFGERLELLVRENGKVKAEAEVELGVFSWRSELAIELASTLNEVRRFAAQAVRPQPSLTTHGDHATVHRRYVAPPFRSEVSRMSLGVVTIIVPYNWPIAILAASLPYALVAGNTVVVKPPPTAPLCVLRTVHLLAARLPPGVLNVVSGSNEAVAPLIRHPLVRKVVFTGSTAAGVQIMKMAAENMTRVTLELGGNDPALVLDDADLGDEAVRRLVTAAFLTSGQVCMGIKRVYVHRSRYDELVGKTSELLKHYVVGHGLEPRTTMGPLNHARQRDIVVGMLDEAKAAGYEVLSLGELAESSGESEGFFLRPALVLDPSPELRIVTEEQFGPALPICAYDDLNPLIERLNGEWSGLCSSVWTMDDERAREVASRLRTGTTWINNANAVAQDDRAPFGGFRMSGVGRELGLDGLLEFCELHTVTHPA